MTILAEKENVAKNYVKALNLTKTKNGKYESADKKIKLTFAAGHLYTSYEPQDYNLEFKKWKKEDLPIIPKKYLYKPIKTKSEFRKNCEEVLREAIKTGDEIVIATDPDREGEVIARLILNTLKAPKEKLTRIWACEGLDKSEIIKGIKNRKSDSEYDLLAEQGIYQKESDWVMGINLTRCYSLINGTLFSVGRVQTAVLKEIYRNLMEITLFRPQRYYECRLQMATGTVGFLLNADNGKKSFNSKDEIINFINKYKGRTVTCVRSKSVTKSEMPPRLYDLAKLQSDCYSLYTISVDRTLNYAQDLYNIKGVLSYPRTDSVALSEEDVSYAKELYQKLKNKRNDFSFADEENININNKRLFNSKEVRGHHGIIPSNFLEKEDSDEWRVWDLVFRRFMMQCMCEYLYDEETAVFAVDGNEILCEGKTVKRKGWKEADLKKENKTQSLSFNEGDTDVIKEIEILEKMTEPPKFYNEGSIISYMRNPGGTDEEGIRLSSIGTEATQANIIQTLFKREYIKTVKKHIEITERGIKLVEQIKENPLLDKNTDVESTTRWERLNKENPKALLEEIENVTRKSVEVLKKDMDTVIEKKILGKCPECGGDILKGKKGYYCSNWKEKGCKENLAFHIMGNEITDELMTRLLNEGKLDVMEGVTKDGSKCNFEIKIMNNAITLNFIGDSEAICVCPKCNKGNIITMKKVFKCTDSGCGLFFYKNSSGITFTRDMIKSLCNGEEVKAVQTKKDNSTASVTLHLKTDEWKIGLSY